jgi:hypothetical protein
VRGIFTKRQSYVQVYEKHSESHSVTGVNLKIVP